MISNYLGTIAYLIMAWTVGMAIIKLCGLDKNNYKKYAYINLPIGVTISALIAAFFYLRLGLEISFVRVGYLLAFILSIAVLIRWKVKKEELCSLLVLFVIFIIMSIPGAIRGEKLYVHKGNIYDHYFYLAEVIYMSQHPYKYGIDLYANNALSDVLTFGFWAIKGDRPTTPLLCAVLCGKGWGNVFFQAYLFNMLMLTSMIGSMLFALELISQKILSKKTNVIFLMVSIAYIWGFYGQIQYDINAWPQQTAMSCLLAYVCVFSLLITNINEMKAKIGQYVLLIFMGAGMFLIYPENTFIHGGCIIIISLVLIALRKVKIDVKSFLMLVMIPIGLMLVVFITDWDTFKFAITQVQSGESDVRQSWASYFDAYWNGYFPFMDSASFVKHAIKKGLAFLPSISGMYFLVPSFNFGNKILLALWIAIDLFVCVGIISIIISTIIRLIISIREKKYNHIDSFRIFLCLGLCFFGYYLFRHKDWSAGKILLYMSPYYYLALVYPIVAYKKAKDGIKKDKGKLLSIVSTALLTVSIFFVLTQVFFAGARVHNIFTNPNGTGYMGVYPSDQAPYLKQTFNYNFDASKYNNENEVVVCVDDPWYQSYLEMCLEYEGISYYSIPDYVFYYNGLKDNQVEYKDGDVQIYE